MVEGTAEVWAREDARSVGPAELALDIAVVHEALRASYSHGWTSSGI
jgi:hypothetical protein